MMTKYNVTIGNKRTTTTPEQSDVVSSKKRKIDEISNTKVEKKTTETVVN